MKFNQADIIDIDGLELIDLEQLDFPKTAELWDQLAKEFHLSCDPTYSWGHNVEEHARVLADACKGDLQLVATFFATLRGPQTVPHWKWEKLPAAIRRVVLAPAKKGFAHFLLEVYPHLPPEVATKWMNQNPTTLPSYFCIAARTTEVNKAGYPVIFDISLKGQSITRLLTQGLAPKLLQAHYQEIKPHLLSIYAVLETNQRRRKDPTILQPFLHELKTLIQKLATDYVKQAIAQKGKACQRG